MTLKSNHKPAYRTVAEAMKAQGLTDEKVAQAVGCDRTWITKIRRGEKLRALRMPIRISRLLNVPIEALAAADAA